MSAGSQADSCSEESDEEESESSSNSGTSTAPVGVDLKQETLKAVYQQWRLQTTANSSDATGSTTSEKDQIQATDSGAACVEIEEHQEPPSVKSSPIVTLPYEVLLGIFRWAVGSDLDTRILGRLAQVCRGFYLLSCDPFLWRSICLRQWPKLCGDQNTDPSVQNQIPDRYGYASWREMAIRRPHVLFDGCYLCRVTYVRMGEPQFSDVCRQFHLVVYYRGIRFFADGRVCMLTSAYSPNAIVEALKSARGGAGSDSTSSAGVGPAESTENSTNSVGFVHNSKLWGTYEWCDPEFIVCTLFRVRPKEFAQPLRHRHRRNPEPEVQLTFSIRFRIASSKRRLHSILHWDSYEIHTLNLSTQSAHSTSLDVSSDQFPACHFSPVRSYTAEVAAQPL